MIITVTLILPLEDMLLTCAEMLKVPAGCRFARSHSCLMFEIMDILMGGTWLRLYMFRVSVTVSTKPCPIPGLEGNILMWSTCRQCSCSTPITLLSDESCRFSFAKYLELTFYHSHVVPRASLCSHNLYKSYSRFFSLHGNTVCFEYDTIDLVEVRVPPLRLHLAADSKLKLQDIESMRGLLDAYYGSILARIKLVYDNFDAQLSFMSETEVAECRVVLGNMEKRANSERKYLFQLLQQSSVSSMSTDTLAANSVKCLLPGMEFPFDL